MQLKKKPKKNNILKIFQVINGDLGQARSILLKSALHSFEGIQIRFNFLLGKSI